MNTIDIIAVIFGTGGLGTFIGTYVLYYKSKKRKANAEAESAEIKNEQTEVDRLEARLKVRDDKVDTLYIELRKEQAEKQQILAEKHRLEIELEILKIKRCDVRGCTKRQPPSDY